jgi:hypothetical protein
MRGEDIPDIPFLAFTRKFGWVVLERTENASRGSVPMIYSHTRPNSHSVWSNEILAIAALPDVPPEAR